VKALRQLVKNRKAAAGLAILGCFVVMAIIGPWIYGDPNELVGRPLLAPSSAHWFGTSGQGQEVLAQVVAGARSTLVVGFVVGIAVTLIAAAVGITAAFVGGWVDEVLSLAINVFLLLPGLPLAVVIAAYLPPGAGTITLVLIATGWAWNARIVRVQSLSVRSKEYVAAAIVLGENALRVVAVEMLPNLLPVLASCFIGATTYAIGAQVGLEFLGLGDPGASSWGANLFWASNDAALLTGSWWLFVPTGTCVALVGFALVLVNFGLDEIADPRLAAVGGRRDALAATPVATAPIARISHG
jgi:peptide/nickel transport system permease protein